MKLTPANIKKRIVGARTPATLALGLGKDGTLWASNRYWMTPAIRVTALLTHFNQPTGGPGTFQVNGTVTRTGDGVDPDVVLAKSEGCTVPLARALTGNHPAFVRFSDKLPWQAVYRSAEGFHYGIAADDLDWLTDLTSYDGGGQAAAAQFGLGEGERFGEVRVMAKPEEHSENTTPTMVLLAADVIKTVSPVRYEGQTRIDAVTENLGPRTVGVTVATRLGKS
jgi:hypothetical protein